MQAVGLAAQSVNVLPGAYASLLRGSSLTHCNEKSNGSPSRATAGDPLLIRLQWVRATNRHE
jgi:hypothetical protein